MKTAKTATSGLWNIRFSTGQPRWSKLQFEQTHFQREGFLHARVQKTPGSTGIELFPTRGMLQAAFNRMNEFSPKIQAAEPSHVTFWVRGLSFGAAAALLIALGVFIGLRS
jgi:hypothetical protein